jgi:DNA-binding beta-propeller fold protein YncE
VLWTAFDHGPGTGDDQARSLAVSPDGSRVFVTGSSSDPKGTFRYTTIAFDAATGARRWVARYSYQHLRADAASVAVSPGGTQVFVTGGSAGPTGHGSAATVSYNAATGAMRWVARYSPPDGRSAGAGTVTVSPDGATVYIAGTAQVRRGRAFPQNIAVVAYTAATGTQRWAALYPGAASPPPVYGSSALAMALSPDGSAVFVAGQASTQGKALYNTVAFGAATGALLWARQAPLNGFGLPAGIAASSAEVFITGHTTRVRQPPGDRLRDGGL